MADQFQLKALITGVDKLSPALQGIRKNIAGFRKGLKSDGLGEIGFKDVVAGVAIAAPIVAATKAAIDFESSMADVKKVVDFDTPAQFKKMSDDVLGLSKRLPMAARDIAKITAAGGQAGIDKSELAQFSEDAVKMGVAFDQTAEESGDMMAKWRTAFKMGQDDVVALADKINYLGNTGPANARQISSIVTRIGPLGAVAGMASGQIAAMGATLAGVGVQEEVAATGMQNFMLALTAGASASKKQQGIFKALRLDAKDVAVSMQKDAQGTIVRILTAVSKVDKVKQTAVLEGLFGRESIKAIAPMLTNLDLLKRNFERVGDSTLYTGSMQQEYDARAATTANNLQLMSNRFMALGITVGTVVLPPLNEFLASVGPIADGVSSFAAANPVIVKGLLGAAAGLIALRGAATIATAAMKIFTTVSGLTPLGLAVRVLALAAGFLIANWSKVKPFFEKVWGGIKDVFFSFPLVQVIAQNWGPITEFMSALWGATKIVIGAAWDGIKAMFLNFTPLGIVVKNWEPIVTWFSHLWDRVKPYIEPLVSGAKWLGGKLGLEGGSASTGDVLGSGAASLRNWTSAQRTGVSTGTARLASGVLAQRGATNARLQGDLKIRFDGAPPGMRIEQVQTNQPGLSVTPSVGYRSLSGVPQ
ncbi:phage tail tape measure protein, TP901 family, core region [Burkholderia cenocepacia]|uniref:Phage tail tape measure protein, TP901 family, core region n=1 Tax=Burkholderia cenocepacia TaxID=95486 RepID=A0AAN0VNN2_9BURK|nr:phage tail tape measure protein, TP901 family, core region [Burkholderia cenocepacia]